MQYHILLFTMWEEPGAWPLARAGWRFSLQDPHTLQRRGFQNLAELCSYLQQQMALAASAAEDNLGPTGSQGVDEATKAVRDNCPTNSSKPLGSC